MNSTTDKLSDEQKKALKLEWKALYQERGQLQKRLNETGNRQNEIAFALGWWKKDGYK